MDIWEKIKNEKEISDKGWGHASTVITDDDIDYLRNGGMLGYFDGEYTTSIVYQTKD